LPAYVIGEAEVTKPENMKQYGPLIAASVKAYDGTYLARGAKPHVLEGGPAHNILIIQFPDRATAQRWYDSPEYAAAKAVRAGNSNLRLIIVDDFVKDTGVQA
jgi:uncharacterized protein (DUF1330 family)